MTGVYCADKERAASGPRSRILISTDEEGTTRIGLKRNNTSRRMSCSSWQARNQGVDERLGVRCSKNARTRESVARRATYRSGERRLVLVLDQG